MYCIYAIVREARARCSFYQRKTQLCDTEKQRYRSTSDISTEYHNYRFEAASVCAGSQLQCGGGQIVTTGAPQQFSVSKWKPTPTSTHSSTYLSRGLCLPSVYVHIHLYLYHQPTTNRHI